MSETEDAPDRIWVYAPTIPDHNSWIYTNPPPAVAGFTEYVRADLVQAKDAEIAKLRADLEAMTLLKRNYAKMKDAAELREASLLSATEINRKLLLERNSEIARLRAAMEALIAAAQEASLDLGAWVDHGDDLRIEGYDVDYTAAVKARLDAALAALTPPGDLAAKIGGEG